jgi:hypothetical protein
MRPITPAPHSGSPETKITHHGAALALAADTARKAFEAACMVAEISKREFDALREADIAARRSFLEFAQRQGGWTGLRTRSPENSPE